MEPARLILLHSGDPARGALVHVNGYLSASEDDPQELQEWIEGYRAAGQEGPIYNLWWDAYRVVDLVRETVAPMVALPLLSGVVGLAGVVLAGAAQADTHWRQAKRRACEVGAGPALEVLARLTSPSLATSAIGPSLAGKLRVPWIDLSAYSLGARLVHHLLLTPGAEQLGLRHVFLHGGAISTGRDWAGAARRLRGSLVNVHNEQDLVLNSIYRLCEDGRLPVGTTPIPGELPAIVNRPVTGLLGLSPRNHWTYKTILPQTMGTELGKA